MYRRYASLFFICEVGDADNELIALELLHRYVEVLDQYFGNVHAFSFASYYRCADPGAIICRSVSWICTSPSIL